MHALVLYESMFGNTRTIAEAVRRGMVAALGEGDQVRIVEVGQAPSSLPDDLDLIVVGAPTHAFSLSRASTRRDAFDKGDGSPLVSAGIGVREWIEALDHPPRVDVATFDTKVRKPRLPGSAAKSARKALRRQGMHPVSSPTTFYVGGTTGPLLDGEADRARRWGTDLAAAATKAHPGNARRAA